MLRIPGQESWLNVLTLGSSSKVVVLEESTNGPDQAFAQLKVLNEVSDNVSCVKTIFVAEKKQIVTLFATFNGRLACQVVKQMP